MPIKTAKSSFYRGFNYSLKHGFISASALLTLITSNAFATTAYDYDGDGSADIVLRRAANFTQYVISSDGGETEQITFGRNATDIPVSGDFDGDGITDVAVRRASTKFWYVKNSSGIDRTTGHKDGITRLRFGLREEDIPVPADFDGDGITDFAVRRPSNQLWYVRNSSGVDAVTGYSDGITRIRFGRDSGDIPVVADYDGDGKADIAVRRPSTQYWYVLNSSGRDPLTGNTDGITRRRFGTQEADIPVPADFDGDGKADLAVRRPSEQRWYIFNSSGSDYNSLREDGIQRINFGGKADDIPIVADYDGDGKADLAVRRASNQTQYLINSSTGQTQNLEFGDAVTDIPMAAPLQMRMAMVNQAQTGEIQPQANILFPPKIAGVEGADSVWIRGTASADSGIAEVMVNGVAAELQPLSQENAEYHFGSISDAEDDAQTMSWQVEVPYSSDVKVSVTDFNGVVNRSAANSSLNNAEVPSAFTIDDTNNRLLGLKWGTPNLLSIDLSTNSQEIIKSDNGNINVNHMVYASSINRIITAEYNQTDGITLTTINPETASQEPLASYQIPKTTGDWTYFRLEDMDYLPGDNSLYINATMNYEDENRQDLSHIVKYDLSSNSFTIIVDGFFKFDIDPNDPEIYSGMNIYADQIAITDSGLYLGSLSMTMPYHYWSTGFHRLNLAENKMDTIYDFNPHVITSDATDPNVLYDVYFDGFSRISFDTGDVTPLSPEANETDLNLTQPSILEHDSANGRLMLYDWMMNMIMAIDTETGERSRFIHDGIGTGKTLYNPQKMALDEDQGILYVADDGENAPESIVAINLSTGHRTTIGNINQRYNVWIEDLVLDKVNNTLYVVFEDKILAVNAASGVTRTLIEVKDSSLDSDTWMRGAVVDPDRNRLLVTINGSLSVYGVDLSDGTVSVVTEGQDVVESASEYYISRDITLTNNNTLVMLSIIEGNALLIYTDLVDGSQDTIAGVCANLTSFANDVADYPLGIYYHQQRIRNLSDPINGDTLILKGGRNLYSYDLTDGNCAQLWNSSENGIFGGIQDVMSSSLGQWYTTNWGAVYQLDMETGQTVVLGR